MTTNAPQLLYWIMYIMYFFIQYFYSKVKILESY